MASENPQPLRVRLVCPYTDKCFVVCGETLSLKDTLKSCRGLFNRSLSVDGKDKDKVPGWIFSLKEYDRVIEKLQENQAVQLQVCKLETPVVQKTEDERKQEREKYRKPAPKPAEPETQPKKKEAKKPPPPRQEPRSASAPQKELSGFSKLVDDL
jgi:hypothetical protein